jgi:formylglycine-generating enzyme required for sulfatase activity
VAVKQAFFNDDDDLRAAFEREAKLLRKLTHANLPKVTDLFTEGSVQYLVMDFIAGRTLKELLRASGGTIPTEQALDWADQVLAVLEYLHGRTPPVIHRDIKPANLKLTEQGDLYLLDFGLAKGFHTQASRTFGASVAGHTPGYSPIEQMQGAGTDGRSDLYALGATLYHLVTGVAPPDAGMRVVELAAEQGDPLRPAHEVNPKIPARISGALHRALAMSPSKRPATAAEMRQELRDAIAEPTVVHPAVETPAPKRETPQAVSGRGVVVTLAPAVVVAPPAPGFTNALGMEFGLVPAGKFMMGSNKYDNEQPIHEVTIASPFYMGKYQVTQEQWKAVMGNNPSRFKRYDWLPGWLRGDNLPVETVSWDDCQKFINRLNARKDGYVYRLPSEAEWEYACRAGTTGDYADDLDAIAWYRKNSKGKTHPVGEKKPNAWGLHDMHGNVWECCQDGYHYNYYGWHGHYNKAPNDGSVWETGSDNRRILRGGSWYNVADNCRSASRLYYTPADRDVTYGFRLVAARIP